MASIKKLKYGTTPWDKLSRDELLLEVRRQYSAIVSLNSCMRVMRVGHEDEPYWSRHGSGGHALAKSGEILDELHNKYENEDIYRSFFRYADGLLFTRIPNRWWAVCPKCGHMVKGVSGKETEAMFGKRCSEILHLPGDCDGILRRIEWSDLAASQGATGKPSASPSC
jgi:hypothetical protein